MVRLRRTSDPMREAGAAEHGGRFLLYFVWCARPTGGGHYRRRAMVEAWANLLIFYQVHKKAGAPKDAQPYPIYLSSASPIRASTATRLCVGIVAAPVRATTLSGRTYAPPAILLRR